MTEQQSGASDRVARQEAIRRRISPPAGRFVEFSPAAIEQSLTGRFEGQVQKAPDQVAVKTPRLAWSYEELSCQANRLAHAIAAAGGDGQTPVALLLENGAHVVMAMLGVLKAGRILVTLDPGLPADRLLYMLEDSGAGVVVVDAATEVLAGDLARGRAQIIDLDPVTALDSEFLEHDPGLDVSPDALAYIIYTSGSTGQPKGIVYDQRSVLAGIRNYTNAFRIGPGDRLTLLHSVSFSSAMVDIFCALLNGATLYPWDVKAEGLVGLEEWLVQEKVTVMDWVPTPFRYFADTLSTGTRFPHLRLLVLASEPVTRREVDLYRAHFSPGCVLVNRLGATETYNYRLYFVDHETPVEDGPLPAGYAVPDKEVLLLAEGEAGREVGFGQEGEIVVRSAYLARGYWRRPELTTAVFRPDPAGGEKRLYWTGDLGRLQPDGCLEFLGRKDFQVKIRGFRIETGEIETALLGLAALKEAVVVAQENDDGEKILVAFYVPAGELIPPESELRTGLAQRLPDYMLPAAFVPLPSLPLTPSGKVNRRVLTAMAIERNGRNGYAGPRDDTEAQLIAAWERVLGVPRDGRIGIRDNFFELGGHSMSAVRLLVEIQRQFGQKLPPPLFYQQPTVEQLAAILRHPGQRRRNGHQSWSPLVPVRTTGTLTPFFALPGNLGNVFVDLGDLARFLEPSRPFYGLQDGPQNPAGIKAMAALYVEHVRRVQPTGPYLLGGVCFGAVVAWEMAQQLVDQGEDVPLLALIEPPRPWRPSLHGYVSFVQFVISHVVRRLGDRRGADAPQGLQEQGAFLRMKLKLVANVWALRRYTPQTFSGPIHLFLSTESLRIPGNPQRGWRHLAAGGSFLHEIPGTHGSITGDNRLTIEPAHMRVLAEELRACIADPFHHRTKLASEREDQHATVNDTTTADGQNACRG